MKAKHRKILAFGIAVSLLLLSLMPFPYPGRQQGAAEDISAEATEQLPDASQTEQVSEDNETVSEDEMQDTVDKTGNEAGMTDETESQTDETGDETGDETESQTDETTDETGDETTDETESQTDDEVIDETESQTDDEFIDETESQTNDEAGMTDEEILDEKLLDEELLDEEILDEELPVTFSMDTSNTPASRYSSAYRDLSGFAAEAVYENNGNTYQGLLSECWDLAMQSGGGTITLITDVEAYAYDPSIYDGPTGTPHAITWFIGGLSTMSVESGMDVTLDLNGHVLDRNMDEADGTADRAYTVEVFDGGRFTLTDSAGTGKLTGGYGGSCEDGMSYGSSVIVHEGGTFALSGAEISGNTGNGAVVGEGNVELFGAARITGNLDHAGSEHNLQVSGSMDVSVSDLTDNASIGLTIASDRVSDAVYYAGGNASSFHSDDGSAVSMDGNYIVLGESQEADYEMEFHGNDGSVQTGTVYEMFNVLRNTTGGGTVKLMKDVHDTTYRYDFNLAGTFIIDFNGHTLTVDEKITADYLVINKGDTHLILTDNSGRARETTRRVEQAEDPVWDPVSRTYTYYVSYGEDGGTDTGMVSVTDRVTADMSKLGGIDMQSPYARTVLVSSGILTIENGAYRSNGYFVYSDNQNAVLVFENGYIYDCKKRAFNISLSKLFTMTGGVIAGCSGDNGSVIYCDNRFNNNISITGGTITQCEATGCGGAIYYTKMNGTLTIKNTLICNNSAREGGAGFLSRAQIAFDNVSFVNNNAQSGGSVIINSLAQESSFDNCLFLGNTAHQGGAVACRKLNEAYTIKEIKASDTLFIRNTADIGGAVDIRDSIFTMGSGSSIMLNSAERGGGIHFDAKTNGIFTLCDTVSVKGNNGGNVFLTNNSVISVDTGVKTLDVGITTESKPGASAMVKLVKLVISNNMPSYSGWFTSDEGYMIQRNANYLVFKTHDHENAEWIPTSGSPSKGPFTALWSRINGDGTLKLLDDAFVENLELAVNSNITLDLNGHVLYGNSDDSSRSMFTVGNGHTFNIQDSGRPVQTNTTVNSVGMVSYHDMDTERRLVYYVEYPTDDRPQTAIKEVSADITGCGGINTTGYAAVIQASDNAGVKVTGGAYQSLCPFLKYDGSTIEISEALIFNDFDVYGGIVSGNGTLSMKGTTMVGCSSADSGGAMAVSGQTSVTDCTITQCSSEADGGAIMQPSGSLTLSKSTICLNSSGGNGGGLRIMNGVVTDTSFSGNSTKGDGAGLYVSETETVSLSGCPVLGNKASGNGGGMYAVSSDGRLTLADVTVSKNNGTDGDGIYIADGKLYVGEKVRIINNQYDNLYLAEGCLVSGESAGDTDSVELRVTTQVKPERGIDVKIAEEASDAWFKADETYGILQNGKEVFLAAGGVEVQFYAYVERLNETQSGKYTLSLIDTTGGNLPENKPVLPEKFLYLSETGDVMKHMELMPIYEHKDIMSGTADIDSINRFYRENYIMHEIWKAKEGTDPESTDPAQWDIIPYEKGMSMDVKEDDVIRIVAQQTSGTWESDVLFYDYDITDGGWYKTEEDALAQVNKQPTSTQPDIASSQEQWINTVQNGINSASNYGTGSRLGFGNANMGTVLGAEPWDSPDGRININRFNRATNGVIGTFKGGAYGLSSGLDENGNILYSSGITAPMLFNKGTAEGKTTYADYGFEFLRSGDTYVLSSVTNTELTGLEKFINPGPYNGVDHKTVIWTNEFWPMDYAPSYGADGHDPKFGNKNRNISYRGKYEIGKIPLSDALIDHNSYFGFQFEVKFTIPDGYRGPMEYIFFGDDDMWVFLDGKLVCDIGGVHSAVGEYVNLWDYLQKDDSSEHTLSFYWTERGASGSTCWMQFVIPNVNNATQIPQEFAFPFTKTDTEGNPLGGVEFTMYEDDACTIPASVRYSRDTSRNNGRVVFTDLKDGQTYYIKETKPLEGYAPDNSVYVLTQDENKAWFMYKLTDADKTPVDTIVNRPDGLKLPDTGSREAMVLMYIASILLFCSMLAFYIAGRKRGTRHEDK